MHSRHVVMYSRGQLQDWFGGQYWDSIATKLLTQRSGGLGLKPACVLHTCLVVDSTCQINSQAFILHLLCAAGPNTMMGWKR